MESVSVSEFREGLERTWSDSEEEATNIQIKHK